MTSPDSRNATEATGVAADPLELRRQLSDCKFPLSGIREVVFEEYRYWTLGHIGIAKSMPMFELREWVERYSSEARFLVVPFRYDDGFEGLAVVFHEKTRPTLVGEFVAGWVPHDRASEVDEWVAFLNGEMERLVAEEPARMARVEAAAMNRERAAAAAAAPPAAPAADLDAHRAESEKGTAAGFKTRLVDVARGALNAALRPLRRR